MSTNQLSPELWEQLRTQLIPELTESIRRQVLDEFKEEEKRKNEELKARRAEELKVISTYSETMKNSPEPWIDIRGYSQEVDGRLKIELDWNDAFIEQCKREGLSGSSDEQIIQKYLSLLTHNIDQQIQDQSGSETEFE